MLRWKMLALSGGVCRQIRPAGRPEGGAAVVDNRPFATPCNSNEVGLAAKGYGPVQALLRMAVTL